jgi:hypothetical protein
VTAFWILVWILLSAIILGANVWSWIILFKQKQAWESFSKKYKMTFRKGKLLAPAEVEGFIEDYKVNLFTAERRGADVRSRRYMTVLEIVIPGGLVNGGTIGGAEMLPFMESLDTLTRLTPANGKLKDGVHLYARDNDDVKNYLTAERIDHLNQIFSTRNVDILFVFTDTSGVLRLETSDPMADAVKMDKAIQRLIAHLKPLALKPAPAPKTEE